MDKKKTKTDKPVGSQHSDPDPRISRLLAEGTLIGSIALCLIMLVALLTYSAQDQGWSTTGDSEYVANAIGPAGAWFADFFFIHGLALWPIYFPSCLQ